MGATVVFSFLAVAAFIVFSAMVYDDGVQKKYHPVGYTCGGMFVCFLFAVAATSCHEDMHPISVEATVVDVRKFEGRAQIVLVDEQGEVHVFTDWKSDVAAGTHGKLQVAGFTKNATGFTADKKP